jgi:hypothetical protein
MTFVPSVSKKCERGIRGSYQKKKRTLTPVSFPPLEEVKKKNPKNRVHKMKQKFFCYCVCLSTSSVCLFAVAAVIAEGPKRKRWFFCCRKRGLLQGEGGREPQSRLSFCSRTFFFDVRENRLLSNLPIPSVKKKTATNCFRLMFTPAQAFFFRLLKTTRGVLTRERCIQKTQSSNNK